MVCTSLLLYLQDMRTSLFRIMLLIVCSFTASCQENSTKDQKNITAFITNVKQGNKDALSQKVAFPLRRPAPLPPIKNQQEFISHYDEIFDKELVDMIVTSNPAKDWEQMGWRGIMLQDGVVWLDEKGQLIAVNYQSAAEKKRQEALILQDKGQMHASIKEYKLPVCVLETAKFRIRIDDMGEGRYRYASWPVKGHFSDQPDLVINNGTFIPEGSGGNHRFEFKNDGYVYDCAITELGASDAPAAMLTITKGGKTVLSQPATIVK